MLSKRHAAALALVASLVAPGSFSAPAVAQEFPAVTVLRSTTIYRMPGHRPFGQLAKGDRVTLHECTALPGYCQVTLREPGRRLTGWVNSEALDGVVGTK
ncbi:MAG TPA: hypothetical protein VGV07_02145 [Devosia sp.]|jgi:hypothetical protein|uniref:hypothetical protein n=1 Tax=Devosia sp. TaxID=1871048 RepID=UPI002DDD5BA8|nr:hypothetical protein [Devosia sp.]HEV2514024.1 hypothetical protein [Devosia sp.]